MRSVGLSEGLMVPVPDQCPRKSPNGPSPAEAVTTPAPAPIESKSTTKHAFLAKWQTRVTVDRIKKTYNKFWTDFYKKLNWGACPFLGQTSSPFVAGWLLTRLAPRDLGFQAHA